MIKKLFLFISLFSGVCVVNSQTITNKSTLVEQEWNSQLGTTNLTHAIKDEFLRIERIILRQKDDVSPTVIETNNNRLNNLRSKLSQTSPANLKNLYNEIRSFKRQLMLADKDIDFTSIVCIDNAYAKAPDRNHEISTRTENSAVHGGKLLLLNSLDPSTSTKQLAPQKGVSGAFWRPDLSFDGTKVLYCMKDSTRKGYNIYEVGIDGKSYRQVTDGDYNDLDPIYAPDGNMIFTTSRCNHYLRCGNAGYRMFILARSNMNGENIYFISSNIEADFTPVFLPDGRILYTRWEYIDKSVLRIQSLWTVNPDGTNPQTYWGNQSTWPDMLMNARPIPNTDKVVFNASAHHDIYGGPLGVVNYSEGTNYPDGLYNLTNEVPWLEVGAGPEDYYYNNDFSAPQCYMAFQTPYPISENYMLVSARKGTNFNTRQDPSLPNFDLYLMDFDGNMELIYRGENNIFYAQPQRERELPMNIPSSVKWSGKMKKASQEAEWGTLYSSNIYEDSGIPKGKVKSLRILEVEALTYCDGYQTQHQERLPFVKSGAIPQDYHYGYGETVVSLLMDDTPKRIWGTVPVEKDGSVNFKVPPVKGIYFQLLDENGLALQTMRSSTHVMPGEVRGCYGCHATKVQTPKSAMRPTALKRKPSEITPPSWGDSTISFSRFVQPILDKHCISCHSGSEPKGNFDFSHRSSPNSHITWPYVKLVFGDNPKSIAEWVEKTVAGSIIPYHIYPNADIKYPTHETVIPPMTALSYRSRLIEIATSGNHHQVKVSDEEKEKLVAWVDALCPLLGLEEIMMQENIPEEEFVKSSSYNIHRGLSFPPKMRTAPYIHKAFMQDDFKTQNDRIAKDKNNNELPAFLLKEGKRIYQIPKTK